MLRRATYPPGSEARREVGILHRQDERLVEGVIDRLVLVRHDGRVVAAEVIDFKTDALAPGDAAAAAAKLEFYRPQLAAYRSAVAAGFGIPPSAVAARLLVLEADAVLDA